VDSLPPILAVAALEAVFLRVTAGPERQQGQAATVLGMAAPGPQARAQLRLSRAAAEAAVLMEAQGRAQEQGSLALLLAARAAAYPQQMLFLLEVLGATPTAAPAKPRRAVFMARRVLRVVLAPRLLLSPAMQLTASLLVVVGEAAQVSRWLAPEAPGVRPEVAGVVAAPRKTAARLALVDSVARAM
jgi:hypothetical protein